MFSRRLGPPGNQVPHFAGLRAKSAELLPQSIEECEGVPEIAKYRNSSKKRKKRLGIKTENEDGDEKEKERERNVSEEEAKESKVGS